MNDARITRSLAACAGFGCLSILLFSSRLGAQEIPAGKPGAEDAGASSLATQAPEGLAEIVVTAQKRSQNLQDVPIAVTAVSAESLSASGITNIAQIGAVVPGFQASGVGSNFEPRLRGVGSAANGPGVENPVALVVDGVYYANQGFGPGAVEDISQLAVLKGPQGTLFGRNATGGVLQITTRDPSSIPYAEVSSSLDNYWTTSNYAYVTGPLADKVSGNLSLAYTYQGKGWGHDIETDEATHRDLRDIAARAKVLIAASDDLSVKVNLDYVNRDNTNAGNYRPFDGTQPLLGGFRATSNPWDTDVPSGPAQSTTGGGISVDVDKDLSFAHLLSISAYRNISDSVFFWASSAPLPLESVFVEETGQEATEELQLISEKSETFNWVTGLYYFYSDESARPVTVSLGGPLITTPESLDRIDVYSDTTSNSIAAYSQATAAIMKDTNLTVGLRYTYERRRFSGEELGGLANGVSIGELPLAAFDPTLSFEKPTWRVALDHNFTPDVMAYISDNRGFKSGGFNGFDPANPPYAPEQLDDYEVGLKSEFFRHALRVNAGAFYYDYKNIQVTKYTTTADIYNGAAAKLWGLDMDSEADIGPLLFRGGLEWIHSAFSSFPNAEFSTPLPGGGNELHTASAAGNRLPYTPKFTADLSVDYTVEAPVGLLDFNVTNAFNGGYFTEADNFLRQPTYDLLSSSVSWTTKDRKLTVKLFANNLLDKAVITYAYTFPPFAYSTDYENPPRTYGVKATYKFGAR